MSSAILKPCSQKQPNEKQQEKNIQVQSILFMFGPRPSENNPLKKNVFKQEKWRKRRYSSFQKDRHALDVAGSGGISTEKYRPQIFLF